MYIAKLSPIIQALGNNVHTFKIILFIFAVSPLSYSAENSYSLCQKNEVEVFNCKLKSKTLSLCGSREFAKNQGTIQYRFGKPNKIEMQFPEIPKSPKGIFWSSSTGYSGGGESRIHFSNGSYDYIIFDSMIRSNFDGKNNSPIFTTGLAIKKDGKILSIQKCSNNNAQLLEQALTAIEEEEFDYDVTPTP